MAKDPTNSAAPSRLQIAHHDIAASRIFAFPSLVNLRFAPLVMITILFSCLAVFAQSAQPTAPVSSDTKNSDISSEKDFRPLFEEREKLIDELRDLDQAVDDLQTKLRTLRPVDALEQDLKRSQGVLEKLKQRASTPPTEAQQKDIDTQERYIDQIKDNLQTASESKPVLAANKSEQQKKRDRLFKIEQRIAQLFDATRDVNQFRLYATISFGVLVFIVVGGFYLIAWYKQGVAQTIFAGELGMQFVTLFLIVIAIILFGIMGTLEGKELSALLGGLSGYILGRAGTKLTEHQPNNPNQNEKTQGDTQADQSVT